MTKSNPYLTPQSNLNEDSERSIELAKQRGKSFWMLWGLSFLWLLGWMGITVYLVLDSLDSYSFSNWNDGIRTVLVGVFSVLLLSSFGLLLMHRRRFVGLYFVAQGILFFGSMFRQYWFENEKPDLVYFFMGIFVFAVPFMLFMPLYSKYRASDGSENSERGKT